MRCGWCHVCNLNGIRRKRSQECSQQWTIISSTMRMQVQSRETWVTTAEVSENKEMNSLPNCVLAMGMFPIPGSCNLCVCRSLILTPLSALDGTRHDWISWQACATLDAADEKHGTPDRGKVNLDVAVCCGQFSVRTYIFFLPGRNFDSIHFPIYGTAIETISSCVVEVGTFNISQRSENRNPKPMLIGKVERE